MRLLHTFNNDQDARTLSALLLQEGIENQLEITTNTDWGSADYGTMTCKIWVIDEDCVDAALQWLERYLENPNDPRFVTLRPKVSVIPDFFQTPAEKKKPLPTPSKKREPKPAVFTIYLIIVCTLLFFFSLVTVRPYEKVPPALPRTPLFASPLTKTFFYDYPEAYEILDKIVVAYGFDKLVNPATLPDEGRFLLQKYTQTPYWQGIYWKTVNALGKPKQPITFHEPMFEKTQQGQFWRLITPCILHNDIFHLFFNMIWLLVLGMQIERRIGVFRYLMFIILTGVFSNTAQYLMSGANFIGFSGVLCAMITFVWFRQKKAPWEGYQLLPITMKFISIFILAMAGIQVASFFLEIFGQQSIAPGIANTAHLSGGLAGFLLAQLNLFSWQQRTP